MASADLQRGQILPLKDFQQRAQIGEWAWRNMRKQSRDLGIQLCHKIGRNIYVPVDNFYEFLAAVDNDGMRSGEAIDAAAN